MHFFDLFCVLFQFVFTPSSWCITSKYHITIMLVVFSTHKKGWIWNLQTYFIMIYENAKSNITFYNWHYSLWNMLNLAFSSPETLTIVYSTLYALTSLINLFKFLQMYLTLSKEEFTGKKASNTDWSYGRNYYCHRPTQHFCTMVRFIALTYMFRQNCHLQADMNINLTNHLSCASSYCSNLLTRIGIPLRYNKTVPVL
jgi:hypothetical protein